MKYINADKLIAEVERRKEKWLAESRLIRKGKDKAMYAAGKSSGYTEFLSLIDSLQQDEKAVELEMCSQAYWEERGWMMIPPDVTLKGIESLLEQVRKKLQQEQPEGLHFTPLNRLIQKIPSGNWNDAVNNYAKKLRDCLIKEGYRKDAEVLQGYISYMNGNNVPMATMDEQEQPQVADASKMEQQDVDLNAEINKLYDGEYHDTEDVARHFYELGASVMRKRITNPEFSQKVIEKMKYECPVDEFNARKEE